jgi:secondary thiamine-phosphate synthase enzyme
LRLTGYLFESLNLGKEKSMAINLFASETVGSTFKVCSDVVHFETKERLQFVDLTELVKERVRRAGVGYGLVNVHTKHTTAALVVNENEPLLIEDFKELVERWAPRDACYRHNDLEARRFQVPSEERPNGHSHARALVLGMSVSLNITEGQIHLGEFQRIFLVELDGVRKRTVSILLLGLGDEAAEPE